MPGVTANEFFPYPFMGETVNATSWQNLANAVDASLGTLATLTTDAKKPPTCMVSRISAGVAITINTITNVLFPTNVFVDPGSMHSTSVNTDQIILPEPGVWLVRGSVNIAATTTLTAIRAGITLNGTQVIAEQTNPKSATLGWITECYGVVINQAAGDVLRLTGRWSGSGTGTLLDCYLHVTRLTKW